MATLRIQVGRNHNEIVEAFLFGQLGLGPHGTKKVTVSGTGKTISEWRVLDDLPESIQQKLAVLLCIDPTPPADSIDKVGMRVSSDVFWVELSDDELVLVEEAQGYEG